MGTVIINPNKDLQIPAWLDDTYFADILKKDEPNYFKVLEFTPVAAIPPGENFTSVMFRVYMTLEMKDGSIKSKSYILKTMIDLDRGGKIMKELNLFPKEASMYQKYIPEFEALYKDAGYDIQIAPKCVHTEFIDDRINMVFEDLSEKAFGIVDRLAGLDMTHMRRALHKIAELHAASAVWAERNGPFPKDFQVGYVSDTGSREVQEKFFSVKLKSYKEAMTKWGLDDPEKYINSMPTFEQFWNCGLQTLKTDTDAFNVLNHGDYWSSNIMFKYSSEAEISQALLIDFQIVKWGSPALDLLLLITLSAAKDIRIREFDHFVEIYYEHLIDCLKLLKYKKPLPKLRDIQMELYKEDSMFYVFYCMYTHLVVLSLANDKDSNVHSITRDDEFGHQFRMRAFTNPRYIEAMLELFPFYYRRGLLDFKTY